MCQKYSRTKAVLFLCITILLVPLFGCTPKHPTPPFSGLSTTKSYTVLCGRLHKEGVDYWVCFLIDNTRTDKNPGGPAERGPDGLSYTLHPYLEEESGSFRFAYREFPGTVCLGLFFAIENNSSDRDEVPSQTKDLFKYVGDAIVINDTIEIDYIKQTLKLRKKGDQIVEINLPAYSGKLNIMSPELRFQETDYNVFNLYGFHQYCIGGAEDYVDSFGDTSHLVFGQFTFVARGTYTDEMQDQKWFQSIMSKMDGTMVIPNAAPAENELVPF